MLYIGRCWRGYSLGSAVSKGFFATMSSINFRRDEYFYFYERLSINPLNTIPSMLKPIYTLKV